ncbi:unnamed protein product [Rhizopus stolonifer]
MQENYCRYNPAETGALWGKPKKETCQNMELTAKAIEAIADGDLVDRKIHSLEQSYSLMPIHSVFSCVRPAYYIKGYSQESPKFPAWLGHNSSASKNYRALGDLQAHMRTSASGDKSEIRQNYIVTLGDRIFGNIAEKKCQKAMEYMDYYHLDQDSLMIMNDLLFDSKVPWKNIPENTRKEFTQRYNSIHHPILFQSSSEPIKKVMYIPMEDMSEILVEQDVEEEPDKDISDVLDKKYIKETKKRKAANEPTKRKRERKEHIKRSE